jgi:hypothetical protein
MCSDNGADCALELLWLCCVRISAQLSRNGISRRVILAPFDVSADCFAWRPATPLAECGFNQLMLCALFSCVLLHR